MSAAFEGAAQQPGPPGEWRRSAWRARLRTSFHVFPAGSMCSVRRALLLWLVPMFLVVGAGSAAMSYWFFGQMAGSFMDNQMQLLAHAIAANHQVSPLHQYTPEQVHAAGHYVVQVWDRGGQRVASSLPQLQVPLLPSPGLHDIRQDGVRWRAFATVPAGPDGRRVQVLQSESFRSHLAVERAGAAIAPVLILLPLALLVLWRLVAAVSLALGTIARQAAAQDEHTISELPLAHVPEEVRPMIVSFNSLLTRLRDAFATQRRFAQDAAHELRTPITAVALQLENVLRDLPPGACTQSIQPLQAGVARAQRLVDQLLRLSRQEATAADCAGTVDVQVQVRESISALIAMADHRHIDLGMVAEPIAPDAMQLHCVGADLRSLLDNLIENALRYTPEGGVVDVRILGENKRVAVEVVDTGPGIPPDILPRVFDRFFRVPGTVGNGNGLGLAIAQSAAQRCGLRLTLRNRADRSGLIARVEPA